MKAGKHFLHPLFSAAFLEEKIMMQTLKNRKVGIKPDFLNDGLEWFDVIITNGPEKLESQLAATFKIMERFTVKIKRR